MTPIVSVVIPSYNSASWIGRTIASVRQQTLSHIEIIVVDDGSTDDLHEVLAPILASEPRLRVVRQSNRGLAGARNRGIAEARAALVAPLDADDLWHPDFLLAACEALDANPEAPFAFSYSFRITEDDRLIPFTIPRTAPRHDLIGLISLNSVGSGSAAVYRKHAVQGVGGFDEEMGHRGLHGAEDWKLALMLARRASPVMVTRQLVAYRLVETSMSQRDPLRQLKAIRAVIADVRRAFPDLPDRAFRDGNTMMTAWLLPTFAFRRQWGNFAREALRAYAGNPFWFTNPLLRRAHWFRLRIVLAVIGQLLRLQRKRNLLLRDATFAGARPFSYLGD